MNTTDNFDLKIYEGTDLFNPLTVENENFDSIDEQMKKNEDAGIQVATELFTDTIHAITRQVPDASAFRFTAVSRFTAGDTFTVDDVQVSALTTSGEQLPDGAFVIGSEVLAILKGTRLTVISSVNKPAGAQNADKLGGQLPSYYATAEALGDVDDVATSAGELANQNKQDIIELNNSLARKLLWTNSNTSSSFASQTITLNENISNFTRYEIIYRENTTSSFYITSGMIDKDLNTVGMWSSVANYWRTSNAPSGTSIVFSNGRKQTAVGSASNDDTILIPYKIYGYKY